MPKPLYVKTHTKIKVLILCSNAIRCLQVIKELRKSMPNIMVAKVFAKHMKITDQIEELKARPYLIGVGTAARVTKIMETEPEALKASKLDFVLIDGSWKDKTNQTILDITDINLELKKLIESVKDHLKGVYSM
jgi:protein CMS1